MISMLISYYLFSATVVKYLYTRIIIFWIVIFIVALILGNIIFSNTKNLVLSGEQVNNMVSNAKTDSSIESSMHTLHGFNIVPPANP